MAKADQTSGGVLELPVNPADVQSTPGSKPEASPSQTERSIKALIYHLSEAGRIISQELFDGVKRAAEMKARYESLTHLEEANMWVAYGLESRKEPVPGGEGDAAQG